MGKEAKAEAQTEREDAHGLEVLIMVKNWCFESMGVRKQQGCGQRGGSLQARLLKWSLSKRHPASGVARGMPLLPGVLIPCIQDKFPEERFHV